MTRARLIVEADGGSRGNPGHAGYGAVVKDPVTERVIAERAKYLGVVSNNVAEYSGMIAGVRAAQEIEPEACIDIRMDSKLVVEQMSGRWKIKHDEMRRLATLAKETIGDTSVTFTWIPRAENHDADALANEAMDTLGEVRRDYQLPANASCQDPAPESADSSSEHSSLSGEPATRAPGVGVAVHSRPSGASARIADPTSALTLIVVRHGETAMTASRLFSGSAGPDPELSPQGCGQVDGAASLVARIGVDLWPDLPTPSLVLASPILRTKQSGEILAKRIGLEVELSPDFAEASFGEWEGLDHNEVVSRWPDEYRAWAMTSSGRPQGGESMDEVADRVRRGLRHLVDTHAGRTVVIATHVTPIRVLVGLAVRSDPVQWTRLRAVPAGVHILRFTSDGESELVASDLPPVLGL